MYQGHQSFWVVNIIDCFSNGFGLHGKLGVFGYSDIIYRLIEKFPSMHGFLNGQSYYRVFFTLIPRYLWPDKPENTQRIVAYIINPGIINQTTPPSIVGDSYINFGIYGNFSFHCVWLYFL